MTEETPWQFFPDLDEEFLADGVIRRRGRGARGAAVGALIIGWLSSYLGLRWPVVGGAMACLALFLWARPRVPAMAKR